MRSALMHVVKKHQTHPSDSDNTSGRRARRELHDDELFARTVSMKEAGEAESEAESEAEKRKQKKV